MATSDSHQGDPTMVRGLRAWGRRHSFSLFSSLGTLLRHPLGTALTAVVLGIALCLPLGLYVVVDNLEQLDPVSTELGAVSIFLEPGTEAGRAQELQQTLSGWTGVAAVTATSPAEALAEFRRLSGFGAAIEALDENPLPWVLELQLAARPDSEQAPATLISRAEALANVDYAQYDMKWLQRLHAMLDLAAAAVQVLAVLFSLAVVFVVGNTIRLDIENQRDTIEVMSLVGATEAFIRRPFLYAGAWYGLAGGLLAVALLGLALWYLAAPLGRLVSVYQSGFTITSFGMETVFQVLAGSALLGLAGAWLAVHRQLALLNPLRGETPND